MGYNPYPFFARGILFMVVILIGALLSIGLMSPSGIWINSAGNIVDSEIAEQYPSFDTSIVEIGERCLPEHVENMHLVSLQKHDSRIKRSDIVLLDQFDGRFRTPQCYVQEMRYDALCRVRHFSIADDEKKCELPVWKYYWQEELR